MVWSTQLKRERLRRRPETQAPRAGLLAMTDTLGCLTCGEREKNDMPIMKNKPISLDYAGWHEVTEGTIRGLSKPPGFRPTIEIPGVGFFTHSRGEFVQNPTCYFWIPDQVGNDKRGSRE